MKTIKIFALATMLCFASQSYADNNTVKGTATAAEASSEKTITRTEAKKLVNRLKEIHVIAKSEQLSLDQKSQYRKEVNDIKEQIEKMDGFYIYLSLTAILIILLLLILL
jgi:hypothetical protein